jgi:hypothetical protein
MIPKVSYIDSSVYGVGIFNCFSYHSLIATDKMIYGDISVQGIAADQCMILKTADVDVASTFAVPYH